jgi:hypothetical protein
VLVALARHRFQFVVQMATIQYLAPLPQQVVAVAVQTEV